MEHYKLRGDIIGMVLGDGYISNRERKNGKIYCRLETSSISLDYLKWKQEILDDLTSTHILEASKSQWTGKPIYLLGTKNHPLYLQLRMRMYCENYRSVEPFIMNHLSKLGLLFWYLDDGSYDSKLKQIFINSNRYTYTDHLVIQKSLNDNFGLRFNIHQKFKKSTAKRYCLLYLTAKDRIKFFDEIIEPYIQKIPQDLQYKVPIKQELVYLEDRHNKI